MDQDKEILKKSKKRVQKLKLLSKFFDKVDLINIIIKTELIQSYFDINSPNELDINKLELFHLQYTDSLIVLLEKIKKQKEANILALYKEIEANENYIESYSVSNKNVKNFALDKKYQNALMSDYLRAFYYNLTDKRVDLKINSIRQLANDYAMEYYRKISKIEYLLSLPDTKYYEYENNDIERKLLGKLNANNFKIRFICGYNVNNQMFELYRIVDIEENFIWNLQTNEFYFLSSDIAKLLDTTANVSNNKTIVDDLLNRNKELESNIETIKTELPEDIIDLLKKYRETLEKQEILNQVINVDEEMNILNSMLNLNLNNKIE